MIDDLPTRLLVIGGHPRDPPGAARLLRLASSARAAGRAGRGADPVVRAVLGAGVAGARAHRGRRGSERTFLLRQLPSGAKDEQIARTMGLSLRTVRRRVADLMIELGADTRFQAGAEAVRRGVALTEQQIARNALRGLGRSSERTAERARSWPRVETR